MEINKKNNLSYSSDQISKIKYYVKIANKKFAKLESSYCSFWVYDKNEFKKFIKTKYWNFDWKWITISGILLIREMAAVGWHGEDMNGLFMNRYVASIIPITNYNLEKNSFIRHISNRYVNAPAGLFGTLKVNEILSDNLKNFKPHNFFSRSLKRLKFLLYRLVRFNIKNYIKI